jgi:phage tail tape-measure protein
MAEQRTTEEKKGAVGAGAGALAGGAAGAAIGTAVPGIGNAAGAVIGGIVGGVAGAFAGKAIADQIDPKAEEAYWRDNYQTRPYVSDTAYEDLEPAYRYGWETRGRYGQQARFDDYEAELGRGWDSSRGKSRLGWERAKLASRDAWDRIERALPGDADRDGK